MANVHKDLPSLFTAVADSIRTKKESTEKIIADDFPDEIRNLKTGFDYVNPMVTHIADSQFKNCEGLRSVNCENLVSIGASAFEGCAGLKEITIPESVVSIGDWAFYNCRNLISITYTGTVAKWQSIVFDPDWNANTGNYTIHCTDGDIAKDGTVTYHTTT